MSPQMGAFGQAEVIALIAIHAAATVTHGTVDDIADQTDIANHAALPNVHHARQHALNAGADHTGAISNAQHGVRATALAHGHGDLSGIAINDHHARDHGAAQHTDVTRELFLPATEGRVGSGARVSFDAWSAVSGGANLDEPGVNFTMKIPDDFVSFTSVEAVWFSSAAAGNMWWNFRALYAAVGEVYNADLDTPALGVTATGGVNIINVQEPTNPLTLANLASGDYLGILFQRRGTNAADTLDNDVYLLGLLFTYVASQ